MRQGPIRTPDQRVRVFISSTMGELAPERAVLTEVVRRLRLAPVLFELGARPHPPRALYRAYLEQSHIFVGVYWERYGWVAPDMGISGLEDEYRLVEDQPMLLYVKEPAPNREPRLSALLDEMRAGPTPPTTFATPEELADLVANDLAMLLSARFSGRKDFPPESGTAHVAASADTIRQAPPLAPTPLVGRETDVADAIDLLLRDDVRLVTLSGPGGIGKSRVAIEVASRIAGEFPGGVVFVRLGEVTDPVLVMPTIATAAGVRTEGGRSAMDAVMEEFGAKPTLLVLDNFEHLLAAAEDVSVLLSHCPQLTVLVTSRAVLRLHGEWDRPVPPLTQADAVRLFTERATDVRPDAPLTDADHVAIAEIARRLDGLPLAIELAAARVRLLPPAALLRRLGKRLDMLTGGPADLPERQQTLRNTIDWSYDLLQPAEQLLFARLSVFPGGWTLESAEEVCGADGVDDVLGVMSALLERSLISVTETGVDGPRFRMLQVLQEYARERLAVFEPTDHMARRHAEYLSRLARQAEPHLRDVEARVWDAHLEEEVANFRAAVTWLLDRQHIPAAVDLIWSLSIHLWTADHLVEARRWVEGALTHQSLLNVRGRGRLYFMVGSMAFEQGDYDLARTWLPAALAAFGEAGDRREQASTLTMLGATHPHFGKDDAAASSLREALDILRDIDEPWSLAYALINLAALVARTDTAAAAVHAAEALDIAERIDNRPLTAQALMQLGYLSLVRDDVATARTLLQRSVSICQQLRFREGLAYCLDALAALALRERDAERAAVAMGGAQALRESIGAHVWPLLRAEHDAIARAVCRAVGVDAYAQARDRGRALSHSELVAQALAHSRVGAAGR